MAERTEPCVGCLVQAGQQVFGSRRDRDRRRHGHQNVFFIGKGKLQDAVRVIAVAVADPPILQVRVHQVRFAEKGEDFAFDRTGGVKLVDRARNFLDFFEGGFRYPRFAFRGPQAGAEKSRFAFAAVVAGGDFKIINNFLRGFAVDRDRFHGVGDPSQKTIVRGVKIQSGFQCSLSGRPDREFVDLPRFAGHALVVCTSSEFIVERTHGQLFRRGVDGSCFGGVLRPTVGRQGLAPHRQGQKNSRKEQNEFIHHHMISLV